MKRRLLVWVGFLLMLVGALWTLQGLGHVGGSAMTGETSWAIAGPVVAVAGTAMVVIGLRDGGPGRKR